MAHPILHQRASGILLHPTSLPGPYAIGDLGPAAYAFVDFLQRSSQRFWQMLPVGPVGYGNSPYSAASAFAGSPLLVGIEPLVAAGLVDAPTGCVSSGRVDYAIARALRAPLWDQALERAKRSELWSRVRAFAEEQRHWLEDYALYRALHDAHGAVEWTRWEPAYRDREPQALARARRALRAPIEREWLVQYLFADQWKKLRAYAKERGIALMGDLPIFVAHDSADVWQHRELFRLGEDGLPTRVAGVPPDYFSRTGQRWGNPLYRWARLKRTGYAWWVRRFEQMLARFDVIRLDHFIGFQRYWSIDARCPTAIDGKWMKGPGADFFRKLVARFGPLPLIAEDLGAITPAVKRLRRQFGFPSLKILQFAFGNDPSAPDFLPHNYVRSSVVYTGTHDNDTIVGWSTDAGHGERSREQVDRERRAACAYLKSDGTLMHWDMIRTAMMSVARLAITPMQDVLGLGSEARMNRPGDPSGNWEWRLLPDSLSPDLATQLAALTLLYDRPSKTEATSP